MANDDATFRKLELAYWDRVVHPMTMDFSSQYDMMLDEDHYPILPNGDITWIYDDYNEKFNLKSSNLF